MKFHEKLQVKTQKPINTSPMTIAFLGDSVTNGCFEIVEFGEGDVDCIYDCESVYHNLLKKIINNIYQNCPISIINAGISGDKASGGAKRVERDIISKSPDLAVVCYGLNDVMDNDVELYKESLRSIFIQLSKAKIETIFMTPNMLCTSGNNPQITIDWVRKMAIDCAKYQSEGDRMDLFMSAAVQMCTECGVTLCDCYSDWKSLWCKGADINRLLSNHVNHPIREMHELFAWRLFETIFCDEK